jgi:hypothetical protein
VRRLYHRIRCAIKYANKKYHCGRLGGRVEDAADPRKRFAVMYEEILRYVVEADESRCVCECGVCVYVHLGNMCTSAHTPRTPTYSMYQAQQTT